MSGTPAAVSVRLRFGANPVARGRFHRGKAVPLLAEFFDPFTEAAVTPSGVAFSLFRADGTELVIEEITGDGASRGCLLPTSQVGEHVAVVYTTAPSAEVGRIAFDVVEAEPGLSDDEQPAWVTEDAAVVFPSGAPVTVKRIETLPDLGAPADGDKLPAVRDGAAGTLDWSAVSQAVIESAAASEAALAAQAASEAAQAEAEAAALDAGLAAAAAKGVITVTLASGTVADGNASTAFTGSATVVPTAGQLYAFKAPFLSRGAPVTLQLTVGGAPQTARGIRYASEGQLLDGAIPSGVWLLLLYLSNNIFAVIGLAASIEGVAPTVWRINYRVPGDGEARGHLDFFADGRVILYAGGDGTAAAPSMLEVQADGDLRALRGRWLTAANLEVHHPGNPPEVYTDIQAALEILGDGYWEEKLTPRQITTTARWTISGVDKYLDVIVAGALLDGRGMAIGQETDIDIRPAASATLIAPQIWAGTNDGLAITNSTLGSVTTDASAGTFTFTAGDPAAAGMRIGDVWRPSSLAAAANNGRDFTVLGFSGTSNRVVAVTPPPATDAAPDAAWTFTRQGARKLSLPADSAWRVKRLQTRFLCERVTPHTTLETSVFPSPSIVLAPDGQSWPVRFARHMLAGWQEGCGLLGLSRDTHVLEGTAIGAASFLRKGAEDAVTGNFYWNQDTNAPGPNALLARDAILADPHGADIAAFFTVHGLGDLEVFGTGSSTVANLVAGRIAYADWLEAETGISAKWLISPGPPAQDESNTVFPQHRWWPMRDAHRQLWASGDARFVRGAEFYDLQRNKRGERHHPFTEAARFGRRTALAYAKNVLGTAGIFMGMEITGVAEVSPTEYRVTIDYGVGQDIKTPPAPVGFALLPRVAGVVDQFATTPLPVARYDFEGGAGTTVILVIYLSGAGGTGAQLAYPWGPCAALQSPARLVQCLHPVLGEHVPLLTYTRP